MLQSILCVFDSLRVVVFLLIIPLCFFSVSTIFTATLGVYAYSQVIPQLLTQFHKTEDISQRGPILEALSRLLFAARELYASPNGARSVDEDKVLIQFKDELVGCFTMGIGNPSFRKPALDGYMQVVQIAGYLDQQEVGFVVQKINDLVLEEEAEDVRWVLSPPYLHRSLGVIDKFFVIPLITG